MNWRTDKTFRINYIKVHEIWKAFRKVWHEREAMYDHDDEDQVNRALTASISFDLDRVSSALEIPHAEALNIFKAFGMTDLMRVSNSTIDFPTYQQFVKLINDEMLDFLVEVPQLKFWKDAEIQQMDQHQAIGKVLLSLTGGAKEFGKPPALPFPIKKNRLDYFIDGDSITLLRFFDDRTAQISILARNGNDEKLVKKHLDTMRKGSSRSINVALDEKVLDFGWSFVTFTPPSLPFKFRVQFHENTCFIDKYHPQIPIVVHAACHSMDLPFE